MTYNKLGKPFFLFGDFPLSEVPLLVATADIRSCYTVLPAHQLGAAVEENGQNLQQ